MRSNDVTDLSERVLFVHAHPDDETITTGGTIAALVDSGVGVTVLSCTRGEQGEVIPVELKRLEGDGPALAEYRSGELAKAMAILGVADHRYLGESNARLAGFPPRRYLDSGMRWGDDGAEAVATLDRDSLCAAPLGEVAADVATVIEAIGATSVISYDAHGGYGHPDHIRAHDAAERAAEVMGVPFFSIVPDSDGVGEDAAGDIVVDVSSVLRRKTDALRAHRTQLTVDGESFALSSGPFHRIAREEHFRRAIARPVDTAAWRDLGRVARVIGCLLALVVGTALGGIGTVNHQLVLAVAGLRIPSGAILALLLVAALTAGLRLVFDTRVIPFFAGVGIVGAIGILTVGSAGGSVLVPANPAGYAWSYGAAIIVALVLAWPRITAPRRAGVSRPGSSGPGASGPRAVRPPTARDTMEAESEPKGKSAL